MSLKRENNPACGPLARLIAKTGCIVAALGALAGPAIAQDGTGPVPPNAQLRSYGGGWDCNLGYRIDGTVCSQVDVPENAYPTGRSYGKGWKCRRGYQETGGATCEPIYVPDNAFLRSAGHSWQCERGYRPERDACVLIELPENAYLIDDTWGDGWACDRGFVAEAGKCMPIEVPENAFLTNTDYGPSWACERGFLEAAGRCEAVLLPENAYLDVDSYGPGWRCARGYTARYDECIAIELPENAHLDWSGNRWLCDENFKLTDGKCVLGR